MLHSVALLLITAQTSIFVCAQSCCLDPSQLPIDVLQSTCRYWSRQ